MVLGKTEYFLGEQTGRAILHAAIGRFRFSAPVPQQGFKHRSTQIETCQRNKQKNPNRISICLQQIEKMELSLLCLSQEERI